MFCLLFYHLIFNSLGHFFCFWVLCDCLLDVLFSLLSIVQQIYKHFHAWRADVFINCSRRGVAHNLELCLDSMS